MSDHKMTTVELYASWGLGIVFSLRMLGMFMVLPILTTYGTQFHDANETLTGIAIGIYGVSQAIFQIPIGMLSDRFGRKPLIISGLCIFAIGSVIAALTQSIWGIILGRALQGAGAIAAAVMALLSDLTREQNYTKAMSVIGISFGVTFAIAIVLGPIITHKFGLQELFWIISILAVLAIFVTLFIVPSTSTQIFNRESKVVTSNLRYVITDSNLTKLNMSVLCLHVLLMSSFITIPTQLIQIGWLAHEHWKVYFFAMLMALAIATPLLIYAEIKRKMKNIFISCIGLMLFTETLLWAVNNSIWVLFIGLELFLIGFNLMEAMLPSLVSKQSRAGYKGTAMGVYTTSQCIGVAIGGGISGWMLGHVGPHGVFLFNVLITLAWFGMSFSLKEPLYLSSLRFTLKDSAEKFPLEAYLKKQEGVFDLLILPEEHSMYMKVDDQVINRATIENLLSK
ncbi:Inner membrane transport protein YajR [Candidatus Erwinia haradaeae]|uniref:Inner membrane transport protein YajR n=1 Tax=Candidatus Erwinia haradaeae TaxID=1922217 RepID=A0A451DDK8_9GAMM|nr:MFS transporter [Candidatus Erwinia haradaeae]VFP84475.1 Inner membrane transport protein YajR [Candidatus Erwinia haradaeae]